MDPVKNTELPKEFSDAVEKFEAAINDENANITSEFSKECEPKNKKLHMLRCSFSFPDSDDSDWDTDLEDELQTSHDFDKSGGKKYVDACRGLRIIPSKHILQSLTSDFLSAKYRSLGPKEVKAITSALVSNTFVKTLDIENNNIGNAGMIDIARLLQENCFITSLSVAENNLGQSGAALLGKVLKDTSTLLSINFSGNKLSEKESDKIAEGIAANDTVKTLNLCHNEFRCTAGKNIGKAIEVNCALEELDLSWNHLRMEGAIGIANGMSKNNTITTLHLAFNGFADDGAAAMGKALENNDTLTYLDLSYNRISDKGAKAVARGLAENQALCVLKIGYNPITSDGALALLLASKEAKALRELYMNDIVLNEEAVSLVQELLKERNALSITYGGVATGISGDGKLSQEELLKRKIFDLIRNYLVEKRLRMLDLFNQWDKDKSLSLDHREFEVGLAALSIPLSPDMIKFLVRILDTDGNGQVEYSEFVQVSQIE